MGMYIPTELAILEHNYNVNRGQAKTANDTLQYKLEFSNAIKKWVVKPIKENKSYDYLHDMLELLVDPQIRAAASNLDASDVTELNLPENIAALPRPNKLNSISQQTTCFGT